MLDPRTAGFSLPTGKLMKGASQALLDIALTLATGAEKPMMTDDYSELLMGRNWPGVEEAKQLMRTLRMELLELSDQMRARNVERTAAGQLEFHKFDPRNVRCSVSV